MLEEKNSIVRESSVMKFHQSAFYWKNLIFFDAKSSYQKHRRFFEHQNKSVSKIDNVRRNESLCWLKNLITDRNP